MESFLWTKSRVIAATPCVETGGRVARFGSYRAFVAVATPSGTVTFLFTDIQDSTRLWEESPADMAAAMQIQDPRRDPRAAPSIATEDTYSRRVVTDSLRRSPRRPAAPRPRLASRQTQPAIVRPLAVLDRRSDTIVRYPHLIDALVAGANDPIARTADVAELRALIHPFGFRRSMRFKTEELQAMHTPTLLIWGDRDPVGSVHVARRPARLLPNSQLQVLPAGHVRPARPARSRS